MDIKDKVIIVTGASMGIGEATARLLDERGARLVLAARSEEKLRALTNTLRNAIAIPTDMREVREIAEMVDQARQHFGRIDALVNNAGRGLYGTVESINLEAYADILGLNVVGPLVAMQRVVPLMRAEGGGSIVNISSMVSKNYFQNLGGYASTKYALNALSLTARSELEADNIVVSVVYPGLTDTNFGANAYTNNRAAESMTPRNRPGMPGADSPEHVATRVVYALESGDAEVFMH